MLNKLLSKCREYHSTGAYDRAIEMTEKALKVDPESAQAYFLRGKARMNKHDYESAVNDFSKALEIDPNMAIANAGRKICWHKLGRLDPVRVLTQIEYRLKREPLNCCLHYERGICNERIGNKTEALYDYCRAIQLSDRSQSYFYEGRGKLLLDLGRFEEAVEDFTIALRQTLDGFRFPETYFNRARAFAEISEYQKAELDVKRALRIDPGNEEFHQLLTHIKVSLKAEAEKESGRSNK